MKNLRSLNRSLSLVIRKETWDYEWEEDLIGFGAGCRDLSHRQGTNLAISNKESTPLDLPKVLIVLYLTLQHSI